MNEVEKLKQAIIEGIQEKKGKDIVVADLTKIDDTICKYLIVCQGNTPTQVAAISDSIKVTVRKLTNQKPVSADGNRNNLWVALDYTDIVAHVFVPDAREFYDIENLWKDAEICEIPDID